MELKLKPKFWKDIQAVKGDKQIMSALGRIFGQIETAKTIEDVSNCKALRKFDSRYRVKLYLDRKRDYRIGIYLHKNTVWFARFLHRRKIYEENW